MSKIRAVLWWEDKGLMYRAGGEGGGGKLACNVDGKPINIVLPES